MRTADERAEKELEKRHRGARFKQRVREETVALVNFDERRDDAARRGGRRLLRAEHGGEDVDELKRRLSCAQGRNAVPVVHQKPPDQGEERFSGLNQLAHARAENRNDALGAERYDRGEHSAELV